MESIKYLLGFLFKFSFVFFAAAIFWWVAVTFFPGYTLKSIFSLNATSTAIDGSVQSEGWLPSPRSSQGLLRKQKTPNQYDNLYVPGPAYDGSVNAYNGNQGGAPVDYIIYTSTGSQIIRGNRNSVFNNKQQVIQAQATTSASNGYAQKTLFIRNISIYENGHVYTGLSFVGEARETMFKDGKFPIIIVDQNGRAVSVSYAEATTNWAIPGWVKFKVTIKDVLPNKDRCTMVFESAVRSYSNQQSQPIRVAIPILCN